MASGNADGRRHPGGKRKNSASADANRKKTSASDSGSSPERSSSESEERKNGRKPPYPEEGAGRETCRKRREPSRSRSPNAKTQASSGAQRSKPGQSPRRLLHSGPQDPLFGTYELVQFADDKFQATLRLSDKARAAARLRCSEYKGEVCSTKTEAERSAASVFWDDPIAQELAKKLPPSKKARKRRKNCAEASAKRKALYGYGTGVARIIRDDRK